MRKSVIRFLALALTLLFAFVASGCGSYTRVVVKEEPRVKGAKNDGHVVAADRHFHQGMKFFNKGKHKQAIKHFHKAVEKNPRHWEANYYLGLSHREVRDYRVAQHRLQLALDNSPSDKRIKARIHTAFGITWEVIGEKKKAKESFSLALQFDSKNSEAHDGLSRINDNSKKSKSKGKGKKKGHSKNG